MYTTTRLLRGWCTTFHTSIASKFCDEACNLYKHSCGCLKKTSIKINVATEKGNSQNEIWHLTNNEIGVQWFWVQIPLRPAFYSYFKGSFSGEYQMYLFIPLHSYDYLKKILIKIIMVTDKSTTWNEIWHWTNDKIGVAVQIWL